MEMEGGKEEKPMPEGGTDIHTASSMTTTMTVTVRIWCSGERHVSGVDRASWGFWRSMGEGRLGGESGEVNSERGISYLFIWALAICSTFPSHLEGSPIQGQSRGRDIRTVGWLCFRVCVCVCVLCCAVLSEA